MPSRSTRRSSTRTARRRGSRRRSPFATCRETTRMTTQYLLQLFISGLVIGSIYAAVALGFTIIYKATRVVNFAQGEFLMVGAYVCYAFVVQMHVPFWAALLLTIVFALVMAMVLERLVLRPMIGGPVISIIMVTIALSLVMRSPVTAVWGDD